MSLWHITNNLRLWFPVRNIWATPVLQINADSLAPRRATVPPHGEGKGEGDGLAFRSRNSELSFHKHRVHGSHVHWSFTLVA
jgi:hypothetical protein